MKKLSLKALIALGAISASSMQGVYALANQESETGLDKIAQSIEESTTLDLEHKISLNFRLEKYEDLSDQGRGLLLQELEDNGIPVPETIASQPTHISFER